MKSTHREFWWPPELMFGRKAGVEDDPPLASKIVVLLYYTQLFKTHTNGCFWRALAEFGTDRAFSEDGGDLEMLRISILELFEVTAIIDSDNGTCVVPVFSRLTVKPGMALMVGWRLHPVLLELLLSVPLDEAVDNLTDLDGP